MNLKDTLLLFQTEMPIRISAKDIDSKYFSLDEENKIARKIFTKYKNKKKFILHDGPPYANGAIHLGHAYNKIMKDICIRSRFMMDYNAYTKPGFDCHGLPIEHKIITQKTYNSSEEIIQACRAFATSWIANQTESFKKIGVLMDFENPYVTMSPEYQANISFCFGKLVEKGFITRAKKTIPWCCGCQTTLASAEIEYKDRKDPSIYFLFSLEKKFNTDLKINSILPASLVIWTTTPWTLPLNRAVMIKKNSEYLLLESEDKLLIIGKNCLENFTKQTKKEYIIINTIHSNILSQYHAQHPFETERYVPIILDDSVETTEGTACVHTAPGCGPIDYEIGIKNNLEIYSPISNDGRYTEECIISELRDKKISDILGWILSQLEQRGMLWHKGSIIHSYPHCWRSKEGLIFRATPQWFCNLEKNNLKSKVIDAIDTIQFYPSNTISFLKATVTNRWEWCLSRQRLWGVPIIAFINITNNEYWTDPKFIYKIAEKIKIHGIEYWNTVTFEELKPLLPYFINEKEWKKETNILDVWFDSGTSHYAVLSDDDQFPADVYLEGSDQHRGWFQSSLLTSVALRDGKAPMRGIISCSFIVDEKGQKMSKSLGNVVTPEDIISSIGVDGLRLWVSSIMLGGDITIGKKIFENIQEVHRKIRNTARFAVQNLADFDPKTEMVEYDSLGYVDQIVLKKMFEYQIKIINAYQQYNFAEVFHTFIDIANTFLSSFYFDASKDILYCNGQKDSKRKAIQTTMYIILESLNRCIAPILKNTAEEITDHYQSQKEDSIHLSSFYEFDIFRRSNTIEKEYKLAKENPFYVENIKETLDSLKKTKHQRELELITQLRELVFKETEKLRQEQIIKQSTEAALVISLPDASNTFASLFAKIKEESNEILEHTLCDLLIVSEVTIHLGTALEISASKHPGEKCERCWKYCYSKETKGNTTEHVLCQRCIHVIRGIDEIEKSYK